ncbi:MAG: hypothetical protein U1C57_02560 [Candidatus Doudnabacteria bacterium]|nr:hypothetical protein [bacterium]MDZ4243964.1 hypothetical protein [Candidatus Doudnabacteria bacterium]
MKNKSKKIIASFLLAAIVCGTGIFALPDRAQGIESIPGVPGLGSSVPVMGDGGDFQRLNRVVTQKIDETAMIHEIVKGGIIAAMNSALKTMTDELITNLETKLGIKNHLFYQDALVESKYLVDSLRKQYGEEAVPADVAGGVVRLASVFENLPLNTRFSPSQIAELAVRSSRENPEDSAIDALRLIAGASSLFTSSVSCGGVDSLAVRNAASYLAARNAGVLASEIDPRDGVVFYEQMARLGNPLASADFWTLQFQDIGVQNEARARQAAALEISSPGLKAARDKTTGEIATSLSLVSVGEQNAQNAVFNIAIKGSDTIYDTSSFRSFIVSVASSIATDLLADELLSRLGAGSKPEGTEEVSALQRVLVRATPIMLETSQHLVSSVVSSVYDTVSAMIFKGEALAESSSCRSPRQTVSFEDSPLPSPDFNAVQFDVQPQSVAAGGQVTVTWDATSVSGAQVSILPLPTGGEELGASGSLSYIINEDTVFQLTVSDGTNQFSRTWENLVTTIQPSTGIPDFSAVQFDVQPRSVAAGEAITVTWDATSLLEIDPDASAIIFPPLSTNDLGLSGSITYIVNDDTVFSLVVSAGGYSDTKELLITVTSEVQGASTKSFKPRE